MRRMILAVMVLGMTAGAQQPVPANDRAAELRQQIELVQAKAQIDYNSLRDLVEFQNYLQHMGRLQALQQQLQAAQQAAVKPSQPGPSISAPMDLNVVKPATATAKTPTANGGVKP